MPRVKLHPGCYGLEFQDGFRTRRVRPGTSVEVDDYHASLIPGSGNARLGNLSANLTEGIGTKRGMWCASCRRLWNIWNKTCVKCGAGTVPE